MAELQDKIQERYIHETDSSCSLSCGTNLEFADLRPGESLLDLGCGRGEETLQAAELIGPEGKAVGLDLTPQMVEAAQRNADGRKAANVEFVRGNIEQIPFADNTFNVVISNCVINHAEDKNAVFREVNRVLKPGGRFVISDAVTKEPLPDFIKNDPAQWANCFGGAVTEDEYLKAIQVSGFNRSEIITRRKYLKNGYNFISLTIRAVKKS